MRMWRTIALLATMAVGTTIPLPAQQVSEEAMRAALKAQRETMRTLAREIARAVSLSRPIRDSVLNTLTMQLQVAAQELDRTGAQLSRLNDEEQASLARELAKVAAEFRAVADQQRSLTFTVAGTGARPRGRLGVTLTGSQALTIENGAMRTLYRTAPVITSVEPGGPAAAAGCEAGDTIVSLGGTALPGEVTLSELLVPGRRVPLRLRRNGGERTVNVTVGVAAEVRAESPRMMFGVPAMPDFPAPAAPPRTPCTPGAPCISINGSAGGGGTYTFTYGSDTWSLAGAEMTAVTNDLADVVGRAEGVLLLRVAPGSPAQSSGLRGGDVVFQAGEERVTSPRQLQQLLQQARSRGERTLSLRVSRQQQERSVTLRW